MQAQQDTIVCMRYPIVFPLLVFYFYLQYYQGPQRVSFVLSVNEVKKPSGQSKRVRQENLLLLTASRIIVFHCFVAHIY